MAQKGATVRKMKSRQEKTFLGQIDNKQQALIINTDTRRFKIPTGDMGPLPGRASFIIYMGHTVY